MTFKQTFCVLGEGVRAEAGGRLGREGLFFLCGCCAGTPLKGPAADRSLGSSQLASGQCLPSVFALTGSSTSQLLSSTCCFLMTTQVPGAPPDALPCQSPHYPAPSFLKDSTKCAVCMCMASRNIQPKYLLGSVK